MPPETQETEKLTPETLIAQYQSPTDDAALAGLDLVPWSELHHAHGPAVDVPPLLRAALSQNEDHRDFAFQLLHETVWHQGTIYEASAYVVPFLFRMLKAPETPEKWRVALLLSALANGSGYFQGMDQLSTKQRETWRKILARDGRDLETVIQDEGQLTLATRQAVESELELLYPYLEYEDPAIRNYIAQALAHYPQRSHETIPLVERALEKEIDQYAREEILVALATLKGEPSPLPHVRNASREPVDVVNCPQCGSKTFRSLGGKDICPHCGYGSMTSNAPP